MGEERRRDEGTGGREGREGGRGGKEEGVKKGGKAAYTLRLLSAHIMRYQQFTSKQLHFRRLSGSSLLMISWRSGGGWSQVR